MLPADMKQKEVDKVLAAMLDPLLQVCVLGSAELHLIQKASYMINCLHFLHVRKRSRDWKGVVLFPIFFLLWALTQTTIDLIICIPVHH